VPLSPRTSGSLPACLLAIKFVFAQHPVIALYLQNFKCAEIILSIPPLFFSPTFPHFSQIQLAVANKNFATLFLEVDACRARRESKPNNFIFQHMSGSGARRMQFIAPLQRCCSIECERPERAIVISYDISRHAEVIAPPARCAASQGLANSGARINDRATGVILYKARWAVVYNCSLHALGSAANVQ